MKKLTALIMVLIMFFCGNTAFAAVPRGTSLDEMIKKYAWKAPEGYCDKLKELGFEVVEELFGLKLVKYEGTEETVNIPEGIFNIGERAFEGCIAVRKVVFSTSIDMGTIEKYAFKDCINLEEITFSKGLRTIEKCAFINCISLKNISLPDHVRSIGEGAFVGCVSLSNVEFNNELARIECNAFNGCISIKNIEIPKMVLEIGEGAFCNCRSLESAKFNLKLDEYDQCHLCRFVFYNCENLIRVDDVSDVYANQYIFPDGCIVNGEEISWSKERLKLIDEAKSVQEKMAVLLKKLEIDKVDLTQYKSAMLGDKGDNVARLLNKYDGYSALPQVVDEKMFSALSCGKPVLYRGLRSRDGRTGAEYADNFRYGEFYNGVGTSGNGTYTSTNVMTALDYTGRKDNIGILKMILDDSAKIINHEDLYDLFLFYKNIDTNYFIRLYECEGMCNGLCNLDVGNFAEIAGYDAIYIDGTDSYGGDYYVILNRGKVIVSSEYADISEIAA